MISEKAIKEEAKQLIEKEKSLKKQLTSLEKEQRDVAKQLSGLVELARGRGWSAGELSESFGDFAPRRRATKKDAEAVRDAAYEILARNGGEMETKSLLDQIERRGVRITGGGTTSNLAALLMRDEERFHSAGRGRWEAIQNNNKQRSSHD